VECEVHHTLEELAMLFNNLGKPDLIRNRELVLPAMDAGSTELQPARQTCASKLALLVVFDRWIAGLVRSNRTRSAARCHASDRIARGAFEPQPHAAER
jgi:hypothetical protein